MPVTDRVRFTDEGPHMMRLESGNVLLKPSQQRQLMTALRRPQKLGNRLGDFALTISMQRQGRHYDVNANVRDRQGSFRCHARNQDWKAALRQTIKRLTAELHDQCVRRASQAAA
jgi:ribosome-associated translation inhibitor RaiA